MKDLYPHLRTFMWTIHRWLKGVSTPHCDHELHMTTKLTLTFYKIFSHTDGQPMLFTNGLTLHIFKLNVAACNYPVRRHFLTVERMHCILIRLLNSGTKHRDHDDHNYDHKSCVWCLPFITLASVGIYETHPQLISTYWTLNNNNCIHFVDDICIICFIQ